METTAEMWMAACTHALQRHWRTVDPQQLEEVAADLWQDDRLRGLEQDEAATAQPVEYTPWLSGGAPDARASL